MVNYTFQPDPERPGRNQYLGSWSETRCRAIDLPLTKESLILLLRYGQDIENAPYTHQEIAWWADDFYFSQSDRDVEIEETDAEVALDLHLQWQMFLSNSYSLEELQALDFSKVKLPAEWFANWLAQIQS